MLFNLLSIDLMVTMLAFEQLSTERSERRRVAEVVDGTRKLATTVMLFNQASKSIATLARNAQRTAEGSQVISAAAEEMATTIRAISNNAHEVTTAADHSREAISEAQDLAKSTEALMGNASRAAEAMSSSVRTLGDTSREINAILGLISKVAAQTRILALNAAIEAARAGAAGKGFGVVAAEVKALARTVAEATSDISTRIEKLREVVGDLATRSKASEEETHAGAETVARMRERLNEVVERVGNVASNIHGITDILEQQEIASADVAKNITHIASLERESSSLVAHIAEETRSANDTLTKSAPSMADERAPQVLLEVAKIDHVLFKKRIVDALLGGVTWHAKDVPDHHHCRFGKWFDGAHELADVDGFKALEAPHQRVHAAATECLRRLEDRDPDAALASLDEMEQASKVMLAALDEVGAALVKKGARVSPTGAAAGL